MNKIAVINRLPELTVEEVQETLKNYSRPQTSLSLVSLFKFKSLRLLVYCCGFVHMCIDFTYDGTLYNLGRFGLGIYVNQMVVATAEMGAFALCIWLVPKLRRKLSSIVGLALCGIIMLAIAILNF